MEVLSTVYRISKGLRSGSTTNWFLQIIILGHSNEQKFTFSIYRASKSPYEENTRVKVLCRANPAAYTSDNPKVPVAMVVDPSLVDPTVVEAAAGGLAAMVGLSALAEKVAGNVHEKHGDPVVAAFRTVHPKCLLAAFRTSNSPPASIEVAAFRTVHPSHRVAARFRIFSGPVSSVAYDTLYNDMPPRDVLSNLA
eukprot:g46983.t1